MKHPLVTIAAVVYTLPAPSLTSVLTARPATSATEGLAMHYLAASRRIAVKSAPMVITALSVPTSPSLAQLVPTASICRVMALKTALSARSATIKMSQVRRAASVAERPQHQEVATHTANVSALDVTSSRVLVHVSAPRAMCHSMTLLMWTVPMTARLILIQYVAQVS